MPFTDAIRILNMLKRRKVIRDYVVIGAVAATAYMEPIFTQDLDVIVLVDTDEEYWLVLRRLVDFAEGQKGMHYILGGVPVQLFPTTTKPLYGDTLKGARQARVNSLRVKLASPEHLVLLFLEAFRIKDKLRIQHLLSTVNRQELNSLMERFDDETRTLTRRLESLL